MNEAEPKPKPPSGDITSPRHFPQFFHHGRLGLFEKKMPEFQKTLPETAGKDEIPPPPKSP